jgi:hypothetical protein
MGLLTSEALHLTKLTTTLPVVASASLLFYLAVYIIYQRCFHPLARFPGPFLASLTDLWQVYEMLSLQQPYNLTDLHEKYGQFVRYGPDKLSTTAADAIPIVYQKGGRMFPKTEFYDAYGDGTTPNSFGMRDEAVSGRYCALCGSYLAETQYRPILSADDTCPTAFPWQL